MNDQPRRPASPGPAVDDLVARLPALAPCRESIEAAIALLTRTLERGGTILVCGNGGSASDSEHFVADMMKGFLARRPISAEDRARLEQEAGERGARIADGLQDGLAAISLATQGALATAIANDIRYDLVFAQQVHALGRAGDVLLAISTSGNSANVVNAAWVARSRGLPVVALTGRDGGEIAVAADVAIRVPGDRVTEIQELHLPVYHAIALALEQAFFPEPREVGGGHAAGVAPGTRVAADGGPG